MDNISQKSINRVIELLRENTASSNQKEKNTLAAELEKSEIIPALYVMTYLQAVDKVRKDTQVLSGGSDYNIKYKVKRNDFEKFKEGLDHAYGLELNYLLDTEELIKGAMWLLSQALDRKKMICDYDDTTFPKHIQDKCTYEGHEGDNPIRKVELILDYDEDASKWINSVYCYACPDCVEIMNDNAEGSITCDMEIVNES